MEAWWACVLAAGSVGFAWAWGYYAGFNAGSEDIEKCREALLAAARRINAQSDLLAAKAERAV